MVAIERYLALVYTIDTRCKAALQNGSVDMWKLALEAPVRMVCQELRWGIGENYSSLPRDTHKHQAENSGGTPGPGEIEGDLSEADI